MSFRDWLSSPTKIYSHEVLSEKKLIQREESRGMKIWSKTNEGTTLMMPAYSISPFPRNVHHKNAAHTT